MLISIITPLNLTYAETHQVIGLLQGKEEVLLKSKSQGELIEILIKEGQKVKKGDIIAKLDQKKEQVELKLAKAEFHAAKDDYQKSKKLKKFMSAEELTKKKNDFLKKKSNYELKKINLSSKSFIAPIEGIVAKRYIKLGETVSTGEKSFEIINMNELVIDLDVEAKKTTQLKLGDHLDFESELHPEKNFEALIFHIGPVLDKASGTIKVRLSLQNQRLEENYLFKPGTMVHVKLK